jgi:putative heme-binding domain-containing protein
MSRPIFRRLSVCAALLLCWSGLALAQDHADYDPADIEYGLSVYRAQCVTCHGDSGDGVAGVNLRSGQFRRAVSDRDLRALIANGIPDTGMLAFDLDSAEMTGIIAFLRNPNFELDAVTLGDEARGRTIFEGKGDCLSCHRVGQEGPRGSVDLTSIGTARAPSALRRSLLDPTGTMRPIDRPVEIVTDDGERFDGRRLNEDTYTVQILDDDARLRSFDKADLREFRVIAQSPMPAYGDRLDPAELADLLAYLVSLKG